MVLAVLAFWGFYSSIEALYHVATHQSASSGQNKHGTSGHGTTTRGAKSTGAAPRGPVLTTRQIAARVDPALVDVNTTLGYLHAAAAGTGLVLTPSGEILTNNHVIEGATSISVTDIGNGQTYRAIVVGYDRNHDIAVLQLIGASGLRTVTLGNSAFAKVGQRVTGIGNAEGRGGTPSIVIGRITRLDASVLASDELASTSERLTGLIAHDAPIRPGDSGGPLVNTRGQVIGIDTAASTGRYLLGTRTEAFAIPINRALSIATKIEAGSASAAVHIGATGFLGVEVDSASQAAALGVRSGAGAAIGGVLSGGPAARAGLGAGDVITSVGGQPVHSPLGLQAVLEQHHPGDTVSVTWTSLNGQRRSATVVLANGPAG